MPSDDRGPLWPFPSITTMSAVNHLDAMPEAWKRPVFVGTVLGGVSALAYSATNVFLRAAIHCDPIWVSCIKAVPTFVLLLPWLLLRPSKQGRVFPGGASLLILIATALMGQLGGNVLFQWSLGILGMSLTVPLCLGSVILCSALLGRSLLNEPLTRRTIISVILLTVAIWTLSRGAGDASDAIRSSGGPSALQLWAAVVGCVMRLPP